MNFQFTRAGDKETLLADTPVGKVSVEEAQMIVRDAVYVTARALVSYRAECEALRTAVAAFNSDRAPAARIYMKRADRIRADRGEAKLRTLREAIVDIYHDRLCYHDGSKSSTAKSLGVTRQTVISMIRKSKQLAEFRKVKSFWDRGKREPVFKEKADQKGPLPRGNNGSSNTTD